MVFRKGVLDFMCTTCLLPNAYFKANRTTISFQFPKQNSIHIRKRLIFLLLRSIFCCYKCKMIHRKGHVMQFYTTGVTSSIKHLLQSVTWLHHYKWSKETLWKFITKKDYLLFSNGIREIPSKTIFALLSFFSNKKKKMAAQKIFWFVIV